MIFLDSQKKSQKHIKRTQGKDIQPYSTLEIFSLFFDALAIGFWASIKVFKSDINRCPIAILKKKSVSPSKKKLVGGFNPFEKYARQIGSFPQVGVKIKNI